MSAKKPLVRVEDFIGDWQKSPFASASEFPWDVTTRASELISRQIKCLGDDYLIDGDIAIHRSATVEPNATLKGPIIISESCFVANGAYLRGGVFLDRNCIIGPSCEAKTVFMFEGSKIAHLSFVGDSIIGSHANIEAGAMVANYRNEMRLKGILIQWGDHIIDTGHDKFGALISDDVRLGANSVVAPGAILSPGFRLKRLGSIDMHPDAVQTDPPAHHGRSGY
ncbi:hypothetical protein [uncultured Tateyamaria sp.]|uniref:hypothetical protein n=1 Tax=uncultured Tateyamaria sp. TaxID=455651 RepID=UPI00260904BD|nr:hypothetical protein [uncultured Tateyamaria sp.]